MNKNYLSNAMCIFAVVFMIASLVCRDVFSLGVNKYFPVVVIAAVAFFMTRNDLIALVFFLIPLSCGISANYLFFILLIAILSKSRHCNKTQVVIPLIIIVQELVLTLFVDNSHSIITTISYCVIIFLTFFLCLENNNEDFDYKKCIVYYLVGVTTLMAIILILTMQTDLWKGIMLGYQRIGYTTEEVSFDQIRITANANSIAFYALISLTLCFYLVEKLGRGKLLLIIATVFNVYVGLLTVSRTYLMLLALIIIVFICKSKYLKNHRIITLTSIIILGAIVLFYVSKNSSVLDFYSSRFKYSNMSTGGGRTSIMGYYLNWQFDNPLRLIFGTSSVNYKNVVGYEKSLHNGTQQIMISYGIFGLIVFLVAFIQSIRLAKESRRVDIVALLPLITIFIFVQTIQLLNPVEYIMSFILGLFVIKNEVVNF